MIDLKSITPPFMCNIKFYEFLFPKRRLLFGDIVKNELFTNFYFEKVFAYSFSDLHLEIKIFLICCCSAVSSVIFTS